MFDVTTGDRETDRRWVVMSLNLSTCLKVERFGHFSEILFVKVVVVSS